MTPRLRDLVAARVARVACVRRLVLFVLTALCFGATSSAQAQSWTRGRLVLAQTQLSAVDIEARNTTMARALFDEGLRFVDTEQWGDAQDRFGRVLTLRYSAVAAYNLGLAQARLGRGVIAAASLRRLLTDPTLEAKVRERTSALLNELEARFAWLNVRVSGECTGCTVYLNDQEWPWAVIGVAVPVDAGSYALRLRVADQLLAERHLDIAPAAHVEAALVATPEALEAARHGRSVDLSGRSRLDDPSAVAARPRHPSLLKSGWFWGAVGVLAIGAVTALILESQ